MKTNTIGIVAFLVALLFNVMCYSQIQVDDADATATVLKNKLQNGNPDFTITGAIIIKSGTGQKGVFSKGIVGNPNSPGLEIPTGIVLTTGTVNTIKKVGREQSDDNQQVATYSDSDLVSLNMQAIYDPVAIGDCSWYITSQGNRANLVSFNPKRRRNNCC